MKTFARAAALAAGLTLALAGCSSGLGSQALTNLQGCERRYEGVISAGLGAGFSGTVTIHCPARPADGEPLPEAEDE